MATGILQAVDTGVVSDETLRFTTEEVMIKAPGYWLSPALVALASWIANDKNNNVKALNESLKRDDYKTTLFFLLVMRRLARNEASLQWLERYFMHQNPHNLDREFIIILEAVTTGIFPPASRQLMMTNVKNWLDQLTQSDNYINEQKAQWVNFFEAKGPLPDGKYPLLEEFATNWNALETSIKQSKTHDILKTHFNSIFASSAGFSKATKIQLDEILTLLVTNFDDEELPLQQQVRLNQLIIQMEGDKNAAQALMDTEKHIFDEKVDLLQVLTNAAFNPELAGATKATQALAVSISQSWIVEAHDTFTANSRNKVPATIELHIDSFKTTTQNGSDETEQLKKHENYWADFLKNELNKLSFPYGSIIIGTLIFLLGFWGFSMHFIVGLAGFGIGLVLIYNAINNHKKMKQSIKDNIETRKTKSKEVLRGCIAEAVDYRKESATEDAKAEELRQLLIAITPEDFSSISKDTKNILQTN
ncbi:hypothetical protein [Flavobacterium sp. UBA4197]|uniref:hypothetical protein n=1 Tax=Flavobacterium sp. UBA4197 TaxID=1946546 RepID=UPI0025809D60|nr:hypothetical protein [Flavobacterium sp. UBA4197]